MTNSGSQGQGTKPIQVGAIVRNFGAVARVVEVSQARGLVLETVLWWQDGVKQGGIGQRWIANPAKCEVIA